MNRTILLFFCTVEATFTRYGVNGFYRNHIWKGEVSHVMKRNDVVNGILIEAYFFATRRTRKMLILFGTVCHNY